MILFRGALGGGSTIVFFYTICGESFITSLSPAGFSSSVSFGYESRFAKVDRMSALYDHIPCFSLDYFRSILPLRSLMEVLVL